MAQTAEEKKAANRESHRKYYQIHREREKEKIRKYRAEHSEEIRAYDRARYTHRKVRDREIKLKYKYGMLPGDYERLLELQEGGCVICGGNRGKQTLDVDHDHTTGEICGLLCRKCNVGLGYFADNPDWLQRAAGYAEKTRTNTG